MHQKWHEKINKGMVKFLKCDINWYFRFNCFCIYLPFYWFPSEFTVPFNLTILSMDYLLLFAFLPLTAYPLSISTFSAKC